MTFAEHVSRVGGDRSTPRHTLASTSDLSVSGPTPTWPGRSGEVLGSQPGHDRPRGVPSPWWGRRARGGRAVASTPRHRRTAEYSQHGCFWAFNILVHANPTRSSAMVRLDSTSCAWLFYLRLYGGSQSSACSDPISRRQWMWCFSQHTSHCDQKSQLTRVHTNL